MKLSEIKLNPNNPRQISKEKFEKLKKSIQDFEKMMELRPIVIDKDGMILGGNMRYKVLQELGKTEIPDSWVKRADKLTDEEKQRFIVEDNLPFGEWDFDSLGNQFEMDELLDWGFEKKDLIFDSEEFYTKKIKAPIYEPNNEKPKLEELVDESKCNELIKEIEKSDLREEDKKFLKLAAYRHNVFNYSKIADYYANSDKKIQELMEKSALVIIDFNKAIENGYVQTINELLRLADYDE